MAASDDVPPPKRKPTAKGGPKSKKRDDGIDTTNIRNEPRIRKKTKRPDDSGLEDQNNPSEEEQEQENRKRKKGPRTKRRVELENDNSDEGEEERCMDVDVRRKLHEKITFNEVADEPRRSRSTSLTPVALLTVSTQSNLAARKKKTYQESVEDDDDSEAEQPAKRVKARKPRTPSSQVGTHSRSVGAVTSHDPTGKSTIIVKEAWDPFRIFIIVVHAFPNLLKRKKFAREAWNIACEVAKETELVDKATPEMLKNIGERESQVRHDISKKTKEHLLDFYKFKRPQAGGDRREVERRVVKNQDYYKLLIEEMAFVKENPKQMDSAKFYNEALFFLLESLFFRTLDDVGIVCEEYFNPVRPETIALLFTAIRNAIDEWETGQHKSIHFTAGAYAGIYQDILETLRNIGGQYRLDLGNWAWERASKSIGYKIPGKREKPLEFTQEERVAEQEAAAACRARWAKDSRPRAKSVTPPRRANWSQQSRDEDSDEGGVRSSGSDDERMDDEQDDMDKGRDGDSSEPFTP